LRGRGCYLGINNNMRGDFFVWLQVKLPKKIAGSTSEMLRKLQRETNWNPNEEFIERIKDIIDK
jgi:DnaJ-class molecular chaperone